EAAIGTAEIELVEDEKLLCEIEPRAKIEMRQRDRRFTRTLGAVDLRLLIGDIDLPEIAFALWRNQRALEVEIGTAGLDPQLIEGNAAQRAVPMEVRLDRLHHLRFVIGIVEPQIAGTEADIARDFTEAAVGRQRQAK